MVLTALSKKGQKLYLSRWVKQHPNGWNHQDWLQLLATLENRRYSFSPEEVGRYIEAKKKQFFG